MINKFFFIIKNFFKFLKKGGVTYLSLYQINYNKILLGKRILITGGSSGIGLAIAKKCLSEGAYVLITGRNLEKLLSVSKEINNNRLFYLQWDISNVTMIKEKTDEAIKLLGGLDILINNAAYLKNHKYKDVSEEIFDKTFNTNLKSVYFLSKYVCEYFIEHNLYKGVQILNISCMNSLQGGLNPYFLSKRGLNSLTEGLAKEFSNKNIKVNAIAPGICDSSINKCNYMNNAYYGGNRINRIIIPEDVAEIALFLISEASNSIVGQTIVCDGGQTLI